jgi:hypothetical protein
MAFIVFLTLPGLVIGLTLLAFADVIVRKLTPKGLLPWRDGRVSATGFEMLHASLLPGKEHELQQRETIALLRDEAGDGAPPHSRIDLAKGTATLRLPGPR